MATEQLKKPNSDVDVAVYIFLARTVSIIMADWERKISCKVLAEKVFELELKINEVEKISRSIYVHFVRQRQLFYIFYASDTLNYQK